MNPNDPNVAMLEVVAQALGDELREETVFVGGAAAMDAMPTIDGVLGFSNRWYPVAIETATHVDLPSGRRILLITAPAFLATKLEAFEGRGNRDFLFSHDLGDLLAVVDGRDALVSECMRAPPELRAYLRERLAALLDMPAFVEALASHLAGDAASQERLPEMEERLRLIASLDQ